jgi:hypothetical protein
LGKNKNKKELVLSEPIIGVTRNSSVEEPESEDEPNFQARM